ncbi:MAG: hypothetical protein DRP63_09000, partial [Planctomycetota bacterium]
QIHSDAGGGKWHFDAALVVDGKLIGKEFGTDVDFDETHKHLAVSIRHSSGTLTEEEIGIRFGMQEPSSLLRSAIVRMLRAKPESLKIEKETEEAYLVEFESVTGAKRFEKLPRGKVIQALKEQHSEVEELFSAYRRIIEICSKVVQNVGVFRLQVDEMKKEVPPRRQLRLRHDGSNLVQVLQTLRNEYSEKFEEIVRCLRAAAGQIKDVILRLDDMRDALHIRFAEKWTNKTFAAWAMGEGLLHFLALVTLMNVPQPPHLVVIDEIENHLHPHLFKLLIEVMGAAHAEHNMQFVVTTQSPTFLNAEGVELEMVRIIERTKDGGARIVAAKDRVEALKTLGVGDAWFQNLLGGTP